MTIALTCDFCGQPIGDGDEFVAVTVRDSQVLGHDRQAAFTPRVIGGLSGHFHVGDDEHERCYDRMDELLALVRSQARAVGGISVATQEEVDRSRARTSLCGVPEIRSRPRNGLVDSGVSLERAAGMTDDELLAIRDVGPDTVAKLRAASAGEGS